MGPPWIPQNIQKRLLLYVLQQISLFSEIKLPDLEEVSFNNLVLRNLAIDPEKVGKLPGYNLRYGQVGLLELSTMAGGVITAGGGVQIDAKDVEIVISPDFGINDEVSSSVQFLLAQSTAQLANTVMLNDHESGEDQDTDEEDKIQSNSGNSRSNSTSSSCSSKPSALSGVMQRAVEIALGRLHIRITNLKIKFLSELTDLVLEIDELLVNTVNGTRQVKVSGIRIITLKPEVNTGEYEDFESNDAESSFDDDSEDTDENDYCDESLMDSMVFTHNEASSIYMSATSQSFQKDSIPIDPPTANKPIDNKKNAKKEPPIIAHIDYINFDFEGLSNISNLKFDIGIIKVSFAPLVPTVISSLCGIARSLKIKNYQRKKEATFNQQNKNPRFPQYSNDDEVNYEVEDDENNEENNIDSSSSPLLSKLHIAEVIINTTSALLPDGRFASANGIQIILQNLNIKQKSDVLIYGGVETFKITRAVNGEFVDVFKFENQSPSNLSSSELISLTRSVNSPAPSSSSSSGKPQPAKADIRFEVFNKVEDTSITTEITTLLSKPALCFLEYSSLLMLLEFAISLTAINTAYSKMKSTIDSIKASNNAQISSLNRGRIVEKSEVESNLPSTTQFVIQTASIVLDLKLSEKAGLKAIIFPISFNLLQNQLKIAKVVINKTDVNGLETSLAKISSILLVTKDEVFKTFIKRTGMSNAAGGNSLPREVSMASSLSLHINEISISNSLDDIKILSNEFEKFLKSYGELSEKHSFEDTSPHLATSNIESSGLLQSSMFASGSRRSRRGPGYHNSIGGNSFVNNSSRMNIASFRICIKDIVFELIEVLPKLGNLKMNFKEILLYQQQNDFQGSILTCSVIREYKDIQENLVCEYRESPADSLKYPLILIYCKKNDKATSIEFTLRDILVEYYTQWLNLLGKDDEPLQEELATEKVIETVKRAAPSSAQKRFDVRFTLQDCVIGLTPGRLGSKGYLVIEKGNSDITFGVNQFYVKSSLRNISLLLIDDVQNVDKSVLNNRGKIDPRIPLSSYESPLSYYQSIGYITIGNFTSTHIGITFNTEIEEMIKRNAKLHMNDSLSLLDIKVNSDEHQIDLCSDSAYVLIQLISDLKLPLNFSDEDKMKVTVDHEINLLDEENLNLFKANTKDGIPLSRPPSTTKKDAVNDLYERPQQHLETIEAAFQKIDISNSASTDTSEEFSSPSFEEEHFNTNIDSENTKVDPIKLNINLSKTRIYLYDGYDWKETRKSIKGAVKRVEAQVAKEKIKLNNKNVEKRNESVSKKQNKVKFKDIPDSTYDSTGLETVWKQLSQSSEEEEEESIIEETLFESIHLSAPKGITSSELTDKINKSVQNNDGSTDKAEDSIKKTQAQINVELGKSYKNLKLRRSNMHKVLVDLKNIEVNIVVFSTRDPRKDKTDALMEFELLNSVEVRLDTITIYDNVPSSTWNKFLSYMNSLGEREIGTSMLKLSLLNVRPYPNIVSGEAIMKVSVLPLRLHVDQDTLNFLTRFLGFKDKRFELPVDEIMYLQKFQMSPLKLKLDYKPKKVDFVGMRSGNSAEFVNFFVLDGSELTLGEVGVHGILGFGRLGDALRDAWAPSIQQTQITGLLAGLGPLRSIVNIGGGVKDLIAIPIKEYKKDGRLMRSIQKGTASFAKTTGYEVLNLGAKIASGTQVLLEQGEEMLGGEGSAARLPPSWQKKGSRRKSNDNVDMEVKHLDDKDQKKQLNKLLASSQLLHRSVHIDKDQYGSRKLYSYVEIDDDDDDSSGIDRDLLNKSIFLLDEAVPKAKERRDNEVDNASDDEMFEDLEGEEKLVSLYSNQPENLQEGMKLAYRSFGKNMKSTKKVLLRLKNELDESETFQDSLVSVLKSSPIILIRPIIGTTEALSKALMGLGNEIDSRHMVDSRDKYKYDEKEEKS